MKQFTISLGSLKLTEHEFDALWRQASRQFCLDVSVTVTNKEKRQVIKNYIARVIENAMCG